jgi:hypothetical protein
MARLVLATADIDFERGVRDAFDGALDDRLRYWHDDLLADPKRTVQRGSPTTVRKSSPSDRTSTATPRSSWCAPSTASGPTSPW